MNPSQQYDVVIIGGAMVGSALACALAQGEYSKQLKIAVVEGKLFDKSCIDSQDFDPRVSALTTASRRIFQSLGVWQYIENYRNSPFVGMSVWDAEGTGHIEFNAKYMAEKQLGHIVENRVVLAAILDRLEALAMVDWLCPQKLINLERIQNDRDCAQNSTGSRWAVYLSDDTRLETKLLVGADGALSLVRDLADFKVKEKLYQHHSLVSTVRTEKAHDAIARQRFLTTGPLALLPLRDKNAGQHYCSIVWSAEPDTAKNILAMDDTAFCHALGEASEYCLGDILSAEKRIAFPLLERHVEQYVQPGAALIGDAAHTIHPLAGQGVNLGFLDAAVLAEEINRAVARQVDIGNLQVLKRFHRRRKGENTLMMATMAGFKTLFEADALPIRWARNTGMSWMNHLPPLKNKIMARAMGLEGDLPKLARGRPL